MRTMTSVRSLAHAFLVSACIVFMVSCQKDWGETGLFATVEKTTPKQALISFTASFPSGFDSAGSETGVMYSTSGDVIPGSAAEAAAAPGASSIILKHLECGTEYRYRMYVKKGSEYHLGKILSFTTEPLPENAIDLGLSNDVLWADRNIGADSPAGNGEVFAYGELKEKDTYFEDNYSLYRSKDLRPMEIVRYSIPDGYVQESWYDGGKFTGDGKYTLEAEDDVVTQRMGQGWRTPDIADFEILLSETACNRHVLGGAEGSLLSSENGSIMFLPFSWMNMSLEKYSSGMGIYRTSQLYIGGILSPTSRGRSSLSTVVHVLGNSCILSASDRHFGFPVRGVYDCSIEDRTYDPLPEADAYTVPERTSALVDCKLSVSSDDPAKFSFWAYNGEPKHPAQACVSMSFRDLDVLKPGDEVKPTSIRCYQPLSSDPRTNTDRYLGNIYLESRSGDTVTLKWDKVRFNIKSQIVIIDCITECKIEK